jgi:hypothetical protein
MKKIKLISSFLGIMALTVGCSQNGIDKDTSFINTVTSGNIKLASGTLPDISNDNSGNVKITPTGNGVASFNVIFGHANAETTISPGNTATHSYPEGNYTITIISKDLIGNEASATYPFNIVYRVPENLEVKLETAGNIAKVSASALYAKSFLVYFGDVPNEVGTPLAKDQTTPAHEYAKLGTYSVKVVALSGGLAKSEKITDFKITNFPLSLPFTCESTTQDYNSGGTFGGVNFSVVANPFSSGLNTSGNVIKFEKPVGAEEWAGVYKILDTPIDLSTGKKIKILVYSTQVGKQLGIELQASTNGAANTAIFAKTTVANQWEELTFDTSTVTPVIPATAKFKQFNINYNRPNKGTGEVIYLDNIRNTN